jgi:DNA-binding MarR family transcriptional regulator
MQGRTDFGLLLAQALNSYIDHLHGRLGDHGFTDLRPTFGIPLRALHRQPRTLTSLAREVGVTKQAAAKVVGEMERRGLIERTPSPDDRRAVLLRLSRRGESLVAEAIRIGDAVERDVSRRLGPAAAAGMRAGLERLAYDPPWGETATPPSRPVW